MNFHLRRRLDFLVLALPLGIACGPGTGKTDGGDEASGASGTGDSSDEGATASTTAGSGSDTGGAEAACVAYAEKVRACEGAADYAGFEEYCEALIAEYASYYGPGCAVAYEDYFACLSMQTCEQLADEEGECRDEVLVLAQACGGDTGGDDPGGTASGGSEPNPTSG